MLNLINALSSFINEWRCFPNANKIHFSSIKFFIMKSIFFVFAFLAFGAITTQAQDAKGPKMQFDVTTIDYGTIEKGAEPLRKFKFTNVGNEPLIIKGAKGSCGCVVPVYPKEPIMPGETDVIEVRYDTQRVGPFQKQVTINTNEAANDTQVLNIKGDVKDTPAQPSVPASVGGIKQ
jgi:hypothetical protein